MTLEQKIWATEELTDFNHTKSFNEVHHFILGKVGLQISPKGVYSSYINLKGFPKVPGDVWKTNKNPVSIPYEWLKPLAEIWGNE